MPAPASLSPEERSNTCTGQQRRESAIAGRKPSDSRTYDRNISCQFTFLFRILLSKVNLISTSLIPIGLHSTHLSLQLPESAATCFFLHSLASSDLAHSPATCLVAMLRRFQTFVTQSRELATQAHSRRSTVPLPPRFRLEPDRNDHSVG